MFTILLTLFTIGLCPLRLALADPLTRADGLINYPHQTYNSDPNHEGSYPSGSTHADAMPYSVPARIRIKLTRSIQNQDDDRLRAPQVSYYGAVGVGTPVKMFNVVFDTGSNEIWLPTYWSNWVSIIANNLHYSEGYSCKDSSTCTKHNKDFSTDYRGTRLSGSVHEDLFTIYDGLTKDEAPHLPSIQMSFAQNFLVISDASDEQFRYKPYDGVIGLSPVAQSNTGTRNVLLSIQASHSRLATFGNNLTNPVAIYPSVEPYSPYRDQYDNRPGSNAYYNNQDAYYRQNNGRQEHRSGLVNPHADLIFAFWFNPNLNARDGGELMIGDADESRFDGQIIYHKVNSYFDWQLNLMFVQLGDEVISCPNGCNAILDTGANSLIGPRDDIERIYDQLQAHRDEDSDLQLVDCNRIDLYPKFYFRIDTYSYLILPSHYIRMFRHKDRLVCYLAIKPHDSPNWILGTSFIGSYYTVFNFSRRLVGFATPRG